jgi:Leu/Phe-tRNA-protein transferase
MTPHLASFGAREITREEFLEELHAMQELDLKLFETHK